MAAQKQVVPGRGISVQGAIKAFDDLAQTIANPNPDRPLSNAIGSAGRTYCNYISALPGPASGLLGPGITLGALLCEPYWEKNNYSSPVFKNPFTGGQCAVAYQVNFSATADVISCTTGAVTGSRTRAFGPVGTPRTGPITAVYLEPTIPTACGFGNYNLIIEAGSPASAAFLAFSPSVTGTSQMVVTGLTVTVTPVIPGTDVCGNPTPVVRPGPRPAPTPPAFPSGEEPGSESDGQPYFFVPPIESPWPGDNPFDVPALPESDTPDPAGQQPGEPGPPEDTSGTTPAEGEADEGEELVGILVEVLSTPLNANRFQDVPVNVWRGIGYLRMGYPGRLGADISAGIAQSPQFYHAQQRGLTNWQVQARNGFTLRVTPYYRTPEP